MVSQMGRTSSNIDTRKLTEFLNGSAKMEHSITLSQVTDIGAHVCTGVTTKY
jgi:hypothetical protein